LKRKDGHAGVAIGERVEGKSLVSSLARTIHHVVEEQTCDAISAVFGQHATFGRIEYEPVLAVADLEGDGYSFNRCQQHHQVFPIERVDDPLLVKNHEVQLLDDVQPVEPDLFDLYGGEDVAGVFIRAFLHDGT